MTRRKLVLIILTVLVIAWIAGNNAGKQSVESSTPVVKTYTSYEECMADPAAFYCEETP